MSRQSNTKLSQKSFSSWSKVVGHVIVVFDPVSQARFCSQKSNRSGDADACLPIATARLNSPHRVSELRQQSSTTHSPPEGGGTAVYTPVPVRVVAVPVPLTPT